MDSKIMWWVFGGAWLIGTQILLRCFSNVDNTSLFFGVMIGLSSMVIGYKEQLFG